MNNPGTVGIVVAMGLEAEALRSGAPRLAIAGIGRNGARTAAQELAGQGVSALVSWGVAGGLDPALATGDLLIPDLVLCTDGSRHRVDEIWRTRLRQGIGSALGIHGGNLLCADEVAATAAEKNHLWRKFDAVAVDMESAAVAEIAASASLPFIAIRAIADTAGDTIPACALAAVTPGGRTRIGPMLGALARDPVQTPALWRLGRRFARARATLRRVAALAGPGLLAP